MKTRKMIAAVMAVLCMTGAMPAMTSSASYDSRDVNHDGAVNIQDVIAINHHLAGTKYYLEYNQLDANQSHTVDYADSRCVMHATINSSYSACYIRQYGNGYMQPVDMPAVSSTITLDSSVNQTNSRSYIGYSYLTHEEIPEYELTVTTATLNAAQNNQARVLINGDDNRTVAHGYENTGIVLINGGVTGFIVGDHEIATVAHNVYYNNGFSPNISISTYDRTGNPVAGSSLNVAEVHVPLEYAESDNYLALYDYALITVTNDLSDYVHFDIGNCYNMTNSEVGTIPIHVTGRPGLVGEDQETNSTNTLYTHYGEVYGNDNTSFLRYTADASAGQSGAPVYTITRECYDSSEYYTYTALSIHATGGTERNSGPLMTKYHQQFYNNNSYASYGQ